VLTSWLSSVSAGTSTLGSPVIMDMLKVKKGGRTVLVVATSSSVAAAGEEMSSELTWSIRANDDFRER
jgi:hypothetical protein